MTVSSSNIVSGSGGGSHRHADMRLLPTLLDRLCDTAPQQQTEVPREYAPTRKQMREIVQRDLAFLLNTTSIEDQIDRTRFPHAAASTINFGVPPLAGAFIASYSWVEIERIVRRAIQDFEPRLIPDSLIVSPLNAPAAKARYNMLSFEVRGMIHMEPYPLEFMVQSSLDLETSQINVTGVRSG